MPRPHPDKRVTPGNILSTAFAPSGQQLRSVLLDCLWRFLWCVGSGAAGLLIGSTVLVQMSSLNWEGPDLDGASPIIVFAALRQFWTNYGALFIAAFGILLLVSILLWIGLEALFRGGWRRLWLYAGTATARTALLLGTAGIFIMLSIRYESGGTLFIGSIVVLGLWFIVGMFETLLRRDAVDLLATSFLPLSAVMCCLRLAEGVFAFILLGSVAVALLQTTDIGLAIVFGLFVVMIWLVVQSYMVAVRNSAIDIMRRNVVRA